MRSALSRRREVRATQPAPQGVVIREGRIVQPPGVREVTVDCVQGIGDTYWVYQKLERHFDRIHFNVLVTEPSAVQLRALPFLALLPKMGTVRYQMVRQSVYDRVAALHVPVSTVLERAPGVVEYAVNRPLELGMRLEEIDGEAVDYPRPLLAEQPLVAGDYAVFYVSGSKALETWSHPQWAAFYRRLLKTYGVDLPTLLIGTSYDAWALREVSAGLGGLPHRVVADGSIADTLNVIRHAQFMVGYQSGLGVMAEVFDVPQVWLNYNCYPDMLHSWCKRASLESGRFAPFLFREPVDEIVARCARVFA